MSRILALIGFALIWGYGDCHGASFDRAGAEMGDDKEDGVAVVGQDGHCQAQ